MPINSKPLNDNFSSNPIFPREKRFYLDSFYYICSVKYIFFEKILGHNPLPAIFFEKID